MNIDLKKYASICIIFAAFFLGSAIVVTKDILGTVPTFWILTIRFGGAAILLAIIFSKRLHIIDKGYIWRSAVIGTILFSSYACQAVGLNFTTPSKSAFLVVVYCMVVPLLYWLVDKKRPDRYNFIASILCVSGIGCITLSGGEFAFNIGDVLTLAGGFLFACVIVSVAKLVEHRDIFIVTMLEFMFFALCALIVAICIEPMNTQILTNIQNSSLQILYLIVFCSCSSFILQNYGYRNTSPMNASIFMALEAPFTVVISIIGGFEQLTFNMVIGFVLIFMSIICGETKLKFLRKNSVVDILENN